VATKAFPAARSPIMRRARPLSDERRTRSVSKYLLPVLETIAIAFERKRCPALDAGRRGAAPHSAFTSRACSTLLGAVTAGLDPNCAKQPHSSRRAGLQQSGCAAPGPREEK